MSVCRLRRYEYFIHVHISVLKYLVIVLFEQQDTCGKCKVTYSATSGTITKRKEACIPNSSDGFTSPNWVCFMFQFYTYGISFRTKVHEERIMYCFTCCVFE